MLTRQEIKQVKDITASILRKDHGPGSKAQGRYFNDKGKTHRRYSLKWYWFTGNETHTALILKELEKQGITGWEAYLGKDEWDAVVYGIKKKIPLTVTA